MKGIIASVVASFGFVLFYVGVIAAANHNLLVGLGAVSGLVVVIAVLNVLTKEMCNG